MKLSRFFESWGCLQRLLNKLCTSFSSHDVNLSLTTHDFMTCLYLAKTVGNSTKKKNSLGNDYIETILEYNTLGFYSHGYFEPSSIRRQFCKYEIFEGHLEERSGSWSHMLRTHNLICYGLGAPNFLKRHKDLFYSIFILFLGEYKDAIFDILPYIVG